jgi:hypothetical protein
VISLLNCGWIATIPQALPYATLERLPSTYYLF